VARGGAWAERLTAAELTALPDLIMVRAMGSMLWRAARWRLGQSSLAEVASRLDVLAETLRWRTAEGGELGHIVAAAARSRQSLTGYGSPARDGTRIGNDPIQPIPPAWSRATSLAAYGA
jgi:Ser/Thr protein kinase RdoA (MazF antagonist)